MSDQPTVTNITVNASEPGAAAQLAEAINKATPPPTEHILQFFAYNHLPEALREVSKPFSELSVEIMKLPRNPERTVALRKLLEAKDAAVRAALAR